MQRYFIDTYDGQAELLDRTGLLLADDDAARNVALAALSDFVVDEIALDPTSASFRASVRDHQGRVTFRAALSFISETIEHDAPPPNKSTESNANPLLRPTKYKCLTISRPKVRGNTVMHRRSG